MTSARRVLPNGRSDSRVKLSKRAQVQGPYVQIRKKMLEAPAFRALSLSASRILRRLEIEHMAHAGRENGNLICTYQDFVDYGVSVGSIRPALDRLCGLGFIDVEIKGCRTRGGMNIPSRYRLTYLPEGDERATDDWARLDEDAARRVIEKRKKPTPPPVPRNVERTSKNEVREVG